MAERRRCVHHTFCHIKPALSILKLFSYFLTSAENMTSDCAVSSPSEMSPGLCDSRRRKKRTSIETSIRLLLERSFLEVCSASSRHQRAAQHLNIHKDLTLCVCVSTAESEAFIRGGHTDRRSAQHGEGGGARLVL